MWARGQYSEFFLFFKPVLELSEASLELASALLLCFSLPNFRITCTSQDARQRILGFIAERGAHILAQHEPVAVLRQLPEC